MKNKSILQEIVENYDVDYTKNLISVLDLLKFEKLLNVKFGKILKEYLLRYGYIGFQSIEFYGINSKQLEKSDMITQTLYLHTYFPKTKGLIAFNNMDEHDYALVDSEDKIYYYNTITDEMIDMNLNLCDFILNEFKSINSNTNNFK